MCRLVKQDLGVSIEMLIGILNIYEDKQLADKTVSKVRKRFVVICASTFLILWVGALRGGEVFMLEVSEFVKRRDDGRKNNMGHVVVPLMGRFKNETGERNLVLVLANETNGGLKVRKWIDIFTALLKVEDRGSSTGPAICDEAGMVLE